MENIQATHPVQWVHLDYFTVKVTEGGKDVHVLIITDHFMRYAQGLVTSLETAKCTAQALWDQFVVHYGLPESIVSNQGQKFESDCISELCMLEDVQKLHNSPYHPQTKGQWEWFNHALINMLGILQPHKKSGLRDMVPILVHVYNCSRSTATGFSLYYVMYGQKPTLPVDLYFGIQRVNMNATTSTKCIQQLQERMKWAYKTTENVIEKENKRHKWNCDHKVRCTQLGIGDLVLLKWTAFKGKLKIQDDWEGIIYHAEGQP